jgi:hypothetical protein
VKNEWLYYVDGFVRSSVEHLFLPASVYFKEISVKVSAEPLFLSEIKQKPPKRLLQNRD